MNRFLLQPGADCYDKLQLNTEFWPIELQLTLDGCDAHRHLSGLLLYGHLFLSNDLLVPRKAVHHLKSCDCWATTHQLTGGNWNSRPSAGPGYTCGDRVGSFHSDAPSGRLSWNKLCIDLEVCFAMVHYQTVKTTNDKLL